MIAVVGDENAAIRLEQRLVGRQASGGQVIGVSWENFPIQGTPSGGVVHLVSQGGFDGDQWSTTVDPLAEDALALNPIGLGAFASGEDATRFAREQEASFVQVRSLPIGWIDPEFAAQA